MATVVVHVFRPPVVSRVTFSCACRDSPCRPGIMHKQFAKPQPCSADAMMSYTWPGSDWRPSACEADVIATRPQVRCHLQSPHLPDYGSRHGTRPGTGPGTRQNFEICHGVTAIPFPPGFRIPDACRRQSTHDQMHELLPERLELPIVRWTFRTAWTAVGAPAQTGGSPRPAHRHIAI